MNVVRRSILALGLRGGALALAAAAGMLHAARARADWNKSGFESKAVADVLKSLGATGAVESRDITITAPDIAENGAVVPVAVSSRIPNTEQISIIAEKNPFPLAATFGLAGGGEAYVSTRLKMGQTSDVWALVKAGGRYYVAKKEVKVTVGGCG
jgi:sulfur-oxidizing protein SoxY